MALYGSRMTCMQPEPCLGLCQDVFISMSPTEQSEQLRRCEHEHPMNLGGSILKKLLLRSLSSHPWGF
ncbi:hypothetical protein LEMLEM_LOCUS13807 [Lemmus lemmus]